MRFSYLRKKERREGGKEGGREERREEGRGGGKEGRKKEGSTDRQKESNNKRPLMSTSGLHMLYTHIRTQHRHRSMCT